MPESLFGAWRGLRLALVIDANGEMVGSDGTSDSISNDEDRAELFAQRALADLIVTSSKTAAAEGYRASKFAPIQIWSASSETASFQVAQPPGTKPVSWVYTPDLPQALEGLAARTVLFETGPTLSRLLLPHLDQLAITVSNNQISDAKPSLSAALTKLGSSVDDWKDVWSQGVLNSYALLSRRGSDLG